METNQVIVSLNRLAAERSLLKHPFYQAWTAGTLPPARLRNYAIQYYPHVAAFPRYLSALHARCEDLATRQVLLENLIDEERGADNHPELWLRFAAALGITRKEMLAAAPSPATSALVESFMRLATEAPIDTGLAALYVYESQVASAKIDGLKQFYGITAPRGVQFFTVHRAADPEHAQAIAGLIEQYHQGPADATQMLAGARTSLDAVWHLLDAV